MKASHRASALALTLVLALAAMAGCGGATSPARELATLQSNRAQAEADLQKLQAWCADSIKAVRKFMQAPPAAPGASAAEIAALLAKAPEAHALHDSVDAKLVEARRVAQQLERNLDDASKRRAITADDAKRLSDATKSETAWLDVDADSLMLTGRAMTAAEQSLVATDHSLGGRAPRQAAVAEVASLLARIAEASRSPANRNSGAWLASLMPEPSRAPANTSRIGAGDLVVNDTILPANADLNNLGAMEVRDTYYLSSGVGEYEQDGYRGSKSVAVRGIWAPTDTRVVRLNLARGSSSSIDVWNDRNKARSRAGEQAKLSLIDDSGHVYFPIGFIHASSTGDRRVTIKLQHDGALQQIGTFPNLPGSGKDQLFALFTPAVGCTIIGVKLGDEWIAASELVVEPAR